MKTFIRIFYLIDPYLVAGIEFNKVQFDDSYVKHIKGKIHFTTTLAMGKFGSKEFLKLNSISLPQINFSMIQLHFFSIEEVI